VTEVRLCLSGGPERETSLQDQVRAAAGAGFRCLDLWLPTLDEYLASYPSVVLVALLQEHELHVSMVSGLPPLVRREAPERTGGRIATRHEEPVLLLQARLLALCADLDMLGGATVLLPLSPASAAEAARPSGVERALRTLADLTAPFDTRLALTPSLAQANAVSTLANAAAMVERAGRANLGLGLDLSCADLPVELPASFLQRLWAVRLGSVAGERDRASQLRAQCAQLASAGYRGPHSVAPLPGAPSLTEGARSAKKALEGLGDL
jgi:sugar phosphate isomerase/epimerase